MIDEIILAMMIHCGINQITIINQKSRTLGKSFILSQRRWIGKSLFNSWFVSELQVGMYHTWRKITRTRRVTSIDDITRPSPSMYDVKIWTQKQKKGHHVRRSPNFDWSLDREQKKSQYDNALNLGLGWVLRLNSAHP